MPSLKRQKTNYPGVYYVQGKAVGTGKPEKIYYIIYRKNGKQVEEKAGRQYQNDMTPARASALRTDRLRGQLPTNQVKRAATLAAEEEQENRWSICQLWEEYKRSNPALKGLVADESRFKNYIRPQIGEKEPGEITSFDIDGMRVKLLKDHAPQTVRNVLELIRRIINFGVKKHLVEPLRFKIEMPKVDNITTEKLNPDQLQRLLQALDEEENIQAANFMRMALYTGMRKGELCRLRWDEVDFHRGFITIRHPKGGKSQAIPLNDQARAVLEGHPREDSPYVFPGKNGGQRTDFKRPIQRIRDRAGLPADFRPLHGLRHVYASLLASSGQVDMYTLQRLLTHKSPLMTQRYAHLGDDTLKRASNLVGELIEQSIARGEESEAEAS